MQCLRCGYCCVLYDVVILIDPDKKQVEGNAEIKEHEKICRHFKGDKPGEITCAIHEYPGFKDSPCDRHGQIEQGDTPCRMGEYVLKKHPDFLNKYLTGDRNGQKI